MIRFNPLLALRYTITTETSRIDRHIRYKVNMKFANLYIGYMGARESIDPILRIFNTGYTIIGKRLSRISIILYISQIEQHFR